ncbi:MAG: hypothetical protein DRI57_06035 [Deltaproteobacteria bacterium]|nr:MAG: hypothetical protein DRI57_06035 [Deltaproteobacteria bacterium]
MQLSLHLHPNNMDRVFVFLVVVKLVILALQVELVKVLLVELVQLVKLLLVDNQLQLLNIVIVVLNGGLLIVWVYLQFMLFVKMIVVIY